MDGECRKALRFSDLQVDVGSHWVSCARNLSGVVLFEMS
jgi:hypothetical protein